MRRTALICSLLLSLAGSSFEATAEEMWQDYQQKPAIISNNPTKQAEPTEAESSIGTSQAEETAADNNIVRALRLLYRQRQSRKKQQPKRPRQLMKQKHLWQKCQQHQLLQTLQLNRLLSAMSLCRLQISPSLNQS